MITLTFTKPHKAILGFPKTVLPDFAVVTGVNGSGKSQLLEAIKNGAVKVEGIQANDSNIRLFSWATLVPGASGAADPISLTRERSEFIANIANQFASARNNYINAIAKLNVPFLPLDDLPSLLALDHEKCEILQHASGLPGNVWPNLEIRLNQASKTCENALRTNPVILTALSERAKQLGLPLFAFTVSELETSIPLHWTPTDLFQQSFSQIFAGYYRLFDENRYKQYANTHHGESNVFLTDIDFRKRFGDPPWDFVNRLLDEAHLDFTINRPEGRAERPFEAKLIAKNTNAQVSFQDLSSGEKIIMSFALCLYNASDRSRHAIYPKVLLFDEIDAPLHPSMTKDLLRVIQRVLVQENNVRVIMTTHSPSTVALSPSDALFRLDKNPRALVGCSREQAIQALTSGYITVTESTRFVIVEAKQDRLVYSALAKKLTSAAKLGMSPNLVFIQASDKKDREGGGKSQVKSWAEKLPESGVKQILGLIDRDATNVSNGNVFVLQRYSLENYLLDPILIYALLMHKGEHLHVHDSGIADSNYFALSTLDGSQLQKIANAVCGVVEKHSPEVKMVSAGAFNVEYLNGVSIELPMWVREYRGHDLEAAYRKAFQTQIGSSFIITANDCEGLVDMLTERLHILIPKELLDILRALQSA
jgi:predicted ATPase